MSEMHFKDKDRLFFSTFIAVLIHVGLFFLIQWMVKALPETPVYSGPLFVEITDSNAPVMDANELSELQPPEEVENAPLEKPPDPPPAELEETTLTDAQIKPPEPDPLPIDDNTSDTATDKVPVRTSPPKATPRPSGTPRPTTQRTNPPQATSQRTNPPQATQQRTNPPILTPTPTEKSAISGDILANLDNALVNPTTKQSTPPKTTKQPSATTGSVTGTTTGGTTTQITWDVADQAREIIVRGEPDVSQLGNLDFTEVNVELAFSVLPQGFLDSDIKVIRSSGYTQVDNVASAALSEYKFKAVTGTKEMSARIIFTIRNQ